MSNAWRTGSTRAWRRTRAAVLARDRYRCRLRLPGTCADIADCVHHTQGRAHGDDPHQLIAACTPCNLKIGDPTRRDPNPTPRTRW